MKPLRILGTEHTKVGAATLIFKVERDVIRKVDAPVSSA